MSRPRQRPLPSVDNLRKLFDYNPTTGAITHRPRQSDAPLDRRFNRNKAGLVTGCVMNGGYIFIYAFDTMHLAHRLAWALYYGEWPDGEIDHHDLDKTNNSISNLRLATRSQNVSNRRGRAKSGFKGVRRARSGRWVARIGRINIGTFDTPEAAHEAYKVAASDRFGDFLNTDIVLIGTFHSTVAISLTSLGRCHKESAA